MTPKLKQQQRQQEPSPSSQLLSLSDKYDTYRNNDMSTQWENYRGRTPTNHGRKMIQNKGEKRSATPTSSRAVREPFKEVPADPAQILKAMVASPTPKTPAASAVFQEHCIGMEGQKRHDVAGAPIIEFDGGEPEKEQFDLMNIKIVVYGLNGLMCEKEPVKRGLFRRKSFAGGMSFLDASATGRGSSSMGFSGSSISSGDFFSTTEVDCMDHSLHGVPTTAVVSCQKNAISSQTSLETFLPSIPIQRPIATFVNKVRYAASWPSEQSALQQDNGSMDRSSFQIIRCMQQTSYVPGMVGAGNNYIPETVELRINLSRGTELIRLGKATLVVNGDEEGEITMNIPAKPTLFNSRKLKKKKNKRNKYGYFSSDLNRRYFLDDNATLKIGIQVIPEDAVRFNQEKDKVKREQELKQILEKDDLKELLRRMGNDNLDRTERIAMKSLSVDMFAAANETSRNQSQDHGKPLVTHTSNQGSDNPKTSFSDMFCGAMTMPTIPAAFCVASPFSRAQEEPDIPMEIHTNQEIDKFAITSIISSVSESTDGSFLGKFPRLHFGRVCDITLLTHSHLLAYFFRFRRRVSSALQ